MADKSEIFYETRWTEPQKKAAPVLRKTGHQTMGAAQVHAIAMSETYGYAECAEVKRMTIGEVDSEEVVTGTRHGYVAGHEIDLSKDTTKEQAAAISAAQAKLKERKPKAETETSTQQEETTMANGTQTATNGDKAIAGAKKAPAASSKKPVAKKDAGKAGKAAASAKGTKPVAKETAKETVGTPGSLLASFGLRAGSKRAGFVTILCENKGKMLPVKDVLKATYGSPSLDGIGPLAMVIKGTNDMIRANKIAWHVERAKADNGDITIGLKAGAPE